MFSITSDSRCVRRGQAGVALLDALVGIMIFAFGVIGVIGLQASMTKAQTSSKFRADAGNLANELLGIMWADAPANLALYATATCESHPPCNDWKNKVSKTLPGASAAVAVSLVALPAGAPAATVIADVDVTVSWAMPGEGAHKVSTATRVQP